MELASLSYQAPDAREDLSRISSMVIRNAYIQMDVSSIGTARRKIDSLMSSNQAWVSSESTSFGKQTLSSHIIIRVPVQNLDTLISSITMVAKRITHQRVESTDVTEEHIDVESRLSNLMKLETKFQNLLRRTDSIEEILMIESKLTEVRSNIEALQGRLKYLNDATTYSTINLNLTERLSFRFVPEASLEFKQRIREALHLGWTGVIAFTIFVFKLWPIWLVSVLVFAGYFGSKWFKGYQKSRIKLRKKMRKHTPKEPIHEP